MNVVIPRAWNWWRSNICTDKWFILSVCQEFEVWRYRKLSEFFRQLSADELSTELIKIGYVKYNQQQELLAFDGSTPFHIEVHIQAYIENEEKEVLSSYVLIFNENMEVVDDFLFWKYNKSINFAPKAPDAKKRAGYLSVRPP